MDGQTICNRSEGNIEFVFENSLRNPDASFLPDFPFLARQQSTIATKKTRFTASKEYDIVASHGGVDDKQKHDHESKKRVVILDYINTVVVDDRGDNDTRKACVVYRIRWRQTYLSRRLFTLEETMPDNQ